MPIFLGNQEIGLASLGSIPVNNIQQVASAAATIPTTNLIFWLDSTTFTTGSSTWVSNEGLQFSGSFTGATPVQKRTDNDGIVTGNINGVSVIPSSYIKSNKIIMMRNVQKTENGLNVINYPNDKRRYY